MQKRVVIARKMKGNSEAFGNMNVPYFIDDENIPFSCLIESDQAERTSPIKATSISGYSAMTHVQISMPVAIAAGVETWKGNATR